MSIVKQYICLTLLVIALFASSCKNRYEKKIIGDYSVNPDPTKSEIFNQLKLSLKENRTFHLTGKDINLVGNWKADDNGDWTWLNLYFNGLSCECKISGEKYEYVTITNPIYIDTTFNNVERIVFLRN